MKKIILLIAICFEVLLFQSSKPSGFTSQKEMVKKDLTIISTIIGQNNMMFGLRSIQQPILF